MTCKNQQFHPSSANTVRLTSIHWFSSDARYTRISLARFFNPLVNRAHYCVGQGWGTLWTLQLHGYGPGPIGLNRRPRSNQFNRRWMLSVRFYWTRGGSCGNCTALTFLSLNMWLTFCVRWWLFIDYYCVFFDLHCRLLHQQPTLHSNHEPHMPGVVLCCPVTRMTSFRHMWRHRWVIHRRLDHHRVLTARRMCRAHHADHVWSCGDTGSVCVAPVSQNGFRARVWSGKFVRKINEKSGKFRLKFGK